VDSLAKEGQIAAQYVDLQGTPTYDLRYNPNGSYQAIEAISSPDGRVLGKMGHNERITPNTLKNVPITGGATLFRNGVNYFK
jgi:phosphoribosylformylglycinamidine synthase